MSIDKELYSKIKLAFKTSNKTRSLIINKDKESENDIVSVFYNTNVKKLKKLSFIIDAHRDIKKYKNKTHGVEGVVGVKNSNLLKKMLTSKFRLTKFKKEYMSYEVLNDTSLSYAYFNKYRHQIIFGIYNKPIYVKEEKKSNFEKLVINQQTTLSSLKEAIDSLPKITIPDLLLSKNLDDYTKKKKKKKKKIKMSASPLNPFFFDNFMNHHNQMIQQQYIQNAQQNMMNIP